ncbi:MAG: HAD-IIB family hydrolase [Candidatus Woesearchaeota archaeon]
MIFSDIDGTLIHRIEEEGTQPAGSGRYISTRTIDLIQELQQKDQFILITGRRKSGYDQIADVIPHDYAIIEHGGVIISEGVDERWFERVGDTIGKPGEYSGPLWDYAETLRSEGYKIDSEGRIASFRVYNTEPVLTGGELEKLFEKLDKETEGTGMKVIINENMLDVIPRAAGKANAIRFLGSDYLAIGDNLNDIDMLESSNYALCPGNALDEIKSLADYVSPYSYHKGTEDVLEHLKNGF